MLPHHRRHQQAYSLGLGALLCSMSCGERDAERPLHLTPPREAQGQGPVGAPCHSDDHCLDGLRCDRAQPGGSCTRGCASDADCPGQARCAGDPERAQLSCYARCGAQGCRDEYICLSAGLDSVCAPMDAAAPVMPDPEVSGALPFDQIVEALGADCAPQRDAGDPSKWSWRFTLPHDATSLLILPFSTTGQVRPIHLQTPASTLDLINDYRHHNTRYASLGADTYGPLGQGVYGATSFDWPILIPYGPQHAALIAPGGAYTLTAEADAAPCLIVLPDSQRRAALNLNLYLVGVQGLDAEQAAADPELQEALEITRQLFDQAGVRIGAIRYLDASPAASRYAIIRASSDIALLTAHGQPPDAALDSLLSVDVFLVRDIVLEDGPALGVSGGVPGAAGMHGNNNNGVVISTVALGTDNREIAHILAHELGHFLGLRHTTELTRGASAEADMINERLIGLTDPLDDTPECDAPLTRGDACPDITNLMFPVSSRAATTLSPAQGAALRASPLTR